MPERVDQDLAFVSAAAARLQQELARAAAGGAPVMLLGETGTGKSALARRLIELRGNAPEDVTTLDCAELSDAREVGRVARAVASRARRAARRVFLFEEIGRLPADAQAILSEALKGAPVHDLRARDRGPFLISTSGEALAEAVRDHVFRADLFHELCVIEIRVPPLRERREDIAPAVASFLAEAAERAQRSIPRVSDEAMKLLLRHPWPGNLQELRNALERAVVVCTTDTLRPQDLPDSLRR